MSNGTPSPPVAQIVAHTTTTFDETRVDNYYWLRERENPKVIAHLEAENQYTAEILRHTEPLQQQLYQELVGFIKETDQSAPARWGEFFYTVRTEAGKQYPLHCRHATLGAPEQVLLDQNDLAAGKPFFKLGVFKVSPNQQLLAYAADFSGAERFGLYVLDLESGTIVDGPIPNVGYDVEWANDNQTLFYTVPDDSWRIYKLFRHTLGQNPADDLELYHEADEAYNVHLTKTRSGAYLLLNLKSNTTSESHFLPADQPHGAFQPVALRRHGIEYVVHHREESFYLHTNENALNFKVVRVPVSDLNAAPEELIAHRDDVMIEWLDLFSDYIAVYEREAGLQEIRVVDLRSGADHRVSFPEPVYSFTWEGPHFNEEFDTTLLRFSYSSLVTPPSVFDYDMEARTRVLRKQIEVPGYDPAQYRSERIFATAPDGVQVTISLVYRVGTPRDGSSPLFLYGYGSYGAMVDPEFDSKRLSLLNRGFTWAIAHIRGGGEMGRAWYENGKLLHKRNTFTDFIASAEHLIAQGYTAPDRLAIKGRSAGGLLMGAVTTMRPELFRAVIAGVPFVDVINTSLDPTIPLVVAEYEEWGDPRIKEHYDYMLSYSPYDNTTAREYPHILATGGLYDPRVQYWEPAKWVAKLRALKTGTNHVLLKTEMVGGHSGPSGRYDYLKDIALEYAFVLDALGLMTR